MATLLDPAILFFVLGIVAGAARSNLEIPQPVARFLSLYLLMALGLKGGFSLAASGFTPEVFKSLLAALTPAREWRSARAPAAAGRAARRRPGCGHRCASAPPAARPRRPGAPALAPGPPPWLPGRAR